MVGGRLEPMADRLVLVTGDVLGAQAAAAHGKQQPGDLLGWSV
jgi:hypothetical protein